ncbi:hypothetical protein IJ541_01050 [bacterium]|nr:hypothetical protein [bacterium]
MSNFLDRIKYFFLTIKEKDLQNKLKRSTKRSYTNKTTKQVLSKAADLTLNSETLKRIEDVKNNVSAIVKQTNCAPDALLDYIKVSKTPIYKINNADKILNLIKEEEGLIYEKRGFEALYLSLVTLQGIKFKTGPMFILREGVIDKFYMLHNFYRWYSLKSDLPGFDYETQKNFKKFLFDDIPDSMKSLSMEEIISLKEAIARDQEASKFVLDYTKEIKGSKKVLDKIKNEGGANI